MSAVVPFNEFCAKYDLNPENESSKQRYQDYCVNLDLFAKVVEEKKNWGGYRPGAGRKTKYEKTKVMRIPEKYQDAIKALISHLDENDRLDHHYQAVESEPVFIRSLQDKKQHIVFRIEPFK